MAAAVRGRGASRRASFTGLLVLLAASTMFFAAFTSAFMVRRGLSERLGATRAAARCSGSIRRCCWRRASCSNSRAARSRAASAAKFNRWWTSATGAGHSLPARPGAGLAAVEATPAFSSRPIPASSFFYVLTAAHAFHLLGGVLALVYVDVQALRLQLGPGKRTAIDVTAMYWHFLDGLWIYLMILFYGLGVKDDVRSQRRCRATSVWSGGASPYAINSKKFGMWLFIISDALTFSALLIAYTYAAAVDAGLAHAVPFLPEHRFLQRHDVLPALEQLDDGHGGALDEPRQPQSHGGLDSGDHGRRAGVRHPARHGVAQPDRHTST